MRTDEHETQKFSPTAPGRGDSLLSETENFFRKMQQEASKAVWSGKGR